MLTFEEFRDSIVFIKEQREKQEKFIQALEGLAPGEYVNCFLYFPYEAKYVEMIKKAFNLPDAIGELEYWLYDCDFGTSSDCNYESLEELYEVLCHPFVELK